MQGYLLVQGRKGSRADRQQEEDLEEGKFGELG